MFFRYVYSVWHQVILTCHFMPFLEHPFIMPKCLSTPSVQKNDVLWMFCKQLKHKNQSDDTLTAVIAIYVALTVWCPSSLSLYDFGSFSEKTWFTDEPENTHLRTIQIKPVNTLAVNQISQYKSTSSLIPPIREAEDECWALRLHWHLDALTPWRLIV